MTTSSIFLKVSQRKSLTGLQQLCAAKQTYLCYIFTVFFKVSYYVMAASENITGTELLDSYQGSPVQR
jgi:hypothetical protein